MMRRNDDFTDIGHGESPNPNVARASGVLLADGLESLSLKFLPLSGLNSLPPIRENAALFFWAPRESPSSARLLRRAIYQFRSLVAGRRSHPPRSPRRRR